MAHLGVGVIESFAHLHYFPHFLELSQHRLPIEYHVELWWHLSNTNMIQCLWQIFLQKKKSPTPTTPQKEQKNRDLVTPTPFLIHHSSQLWTNCLSPNNITSTWYWEYKTLQRHFLYDLWHNTWGNVLKFTIYHSISGGCSMFNFSIIQIWCNINFVLI